MPSPPHSHPTIPFTSPSLSPSHTHIHSVPFSSSFPSYLYPPVLSGVPKGFPSHSHPSLQGEVSRDISWEDNSPAQLPQDLLRGLLGHRPELTPCTLLPVSQGQEAKVSLRAFGPGPAHAAASLFKRLASLFVQACTTLVCPGPFPSSCPVERGREILTLTLRLAGQHWDMPH